MEFVVKQPPAGQLLSRTIPILTTLTYDHSHPRQFPSMVIPTWIIFDPDNFHQGNCQLGIVRVGVFPKTEICHFKADLIRQIANQIFD